MRWVVILSMCMLVSTFARADSFRCKGKLVRTGDSGNALIRKCGEPVRKYNGRTVIAEYGRQQSVSVSHWVYERRGRKDMVVSVRNGVVVRVEVDRG